MPSRGLGDTIAKFTRATGIAKVVHAASRRLGRDCGCKGRQDRKNAEHPYHAGKIKVGFVSPALALGGVEEFLRLLVAGLSADDRCFVTGIGITDRNLFDPRALARFGSLCPVHGFSPAAAAAAWQGADVLISWGMTNLDPLCRSAPPRLITIVHGEDSGWSGVYAREAVAHRHELVAVSAAAAAMVAEACPGSACHVIANGVDLSRLAPTVTREVARARLEIAPDAFVAAHCGRLSAEKNLDVLVGAVALDPGTHAILVGEGRERSALEALADKLGIRPRVHCVGHTYDVADVLVAADCACGLANHEGFWLAGVEAAALGLPLVTTRVGVLREIHAERDRLWQEIASPAAPAAVAAAWRLLRDEPAAARQLADRLRAHVRQRYTAARMVSDWKDLLTGAAR